MMNEKKESDFGTGVAEKHPNGHDEQPDPNEEKVLNSRAETQEEIDGLELLSPDAIEDFQSRWHTIQMSFVDEPYSAVDEANILTVEVFEHIAHSFAKKQNQLKEQWLDNNDHSTEDLRIGLRQYRDFFDQLLAVS